MLDKSTILLILFIVGFVVFNVLYRKNFKIIKTPSVALVTGGVKTGKSLLCVYLALKEYKRRYRKWWFSTHIFKKKIEMPLFYTNATISFGNLKRKKPHKLDKNIRRVTLDLLLRSKRFNYGSVIYAQECSLLADNMDYNDKERNVELSLFNKLIAHETRGGCIYYDTQSVLDAHYSIKRVCSTFNFIEKSYNFLLFHILYVREMVNQENGVNVFTDDVETTTRKVLIPFWYHNKYDRYEFSYLTDDLDVSEDRFHKNSGLVSFNPLYRKLSDKRKKKGV